jgi:FHIPEP family
MNLSILPPSDLLRQVEGIERGLQKQRRLGAVGWLGVAVVQASAVVVQSKYWDNLVSFNWHDLLFGAGGQSGLLAQWPFLLALVILLGSTFLIAWKRFWLQESREPFRYTFAVDDFAAISKEEDPSLVWLKHHLSERLNQRIGRLSILEDEAAPASAAGGDQTERKRGAPASRYESHVHISGHYGTRVERGLWVMEVVPRVRVGPKGSPETMAHPETYPLNAAFKNRQLTTPTPLTPEQYEQLLERVYSSVATEIYRQITKDVLHKIDLLPTNYLRATAYLHEAQDYARSNTLVAFDEAERLFEAAIRLYDPSRRPWPSSFVRWPWHLLRQLAAFELGYARWLSAFAWRRAANTDMMVARAETGYANVLLDRRSLAGMSGNRLNPIFESRPVAERAVRQLARLPRDVAGVPECLFDAHVTLALSWVFIGSLRKSRAELEKARRLLPTRATVDARFAYAAGMIETRPRSRLLRFQRAAELDPKSEAAQFALALEAEKLWRTKPALEADVAKTIVDEYQRVLTLNPGNVATWGNLGYMEWLLADGDGKERERLAKAREHFERGRDYKAIKRETYVAEIDYGLARVAAETGKFSQAYTYLTSALTSYMAQSTAQSYTDSWSSLSEYYFLRIDLPILQRFERYAQAAQRFHDDPKHAPEVPRRVRDSVLAFVKNDYGEACYNYFKRSYDQRYLEQAREAYTESAKLDRSYAIPRYNLFLLNVQEDPLEAERDAEKLYEIEQDWFEAKLALMWKLARHAGGGQRKADERQRERLSSLRESVNANMAASEEKREAIVFESSQTEALPDQLAPYKKPKEARSKSTEAAKLRHDANQLASQRTNLLHGAEQEKKLAQDVLRELVPHKWLWQGRLGRHLTPEKVLMSRTMAWHRWRLRREGRWEREFDNVHVKALYEWGWALLSPGSRRPASDRIFAHIEEHFWQDNFFILRHFREQVEQRLKDVVVDRRVPLRALRTSRAQLVGPSGERFGLAGLLSPYLARLRRLGNAELRYQRRIDRYNRTLACTLLSWLDDDPTGFWALARLDDGLTTVRGGKAGELKVHYSTLDWQDRQRSLLRVLDESRPRSSPALYRWVGDHLKAFQQENHDRRELGGLLQDAAQAIGHDQAKAAEIRLRLESRDRWNGLDGSALAACKRALRARDRDALFRIAKQLHSDEGDPASRDGHLREQEARAYEAVLPSDDPKLLWKVVEPLLRLGRREQSRQALKAYGIAIGDSPDASTLWDLAQVYKELDDWEAAREAFQRALQADDRGDAEQRGPVRHADLYHWEIARARWAEGSYPEALDELELVTGDAPEWRRPGQDPGRLTVWTWFVDELVEQKAIPDQEAYRALRTWLERRQRASTGPDAESARRDAGRALLRLARARRDEKGAPGWAVRDRYGEVRETLPVVAPIMLHGDSALFPGPRSSPMKRLAAACSNLADGIEQEMGIRIPNVLIRASEADQYKGRRFVVKLHEIPLRSGTASRSQTERIVSETIGPVVRQYLDTYVGFAEVDELLVLLRTVPPSTEVQTIATKVVVSGARRLRLVQIFQRLVRESVPVSEPETILTAFDEAAFHGEVDEAVDSMRRALVDRLPRTAPGIPLGPDWEAIVRRWVQRGDGKRFVAVPVGEQELHRRLREQIDARTRADPGAVIVVPDDLRRFVRRLTAPWLPSVAVLAQSELDRPSSELPPLEGAPQLQGVGR